MAPRQEKRNIAEIRRQPSVLTEQERRPRGIRKKLLQTSPRRSERLKDRTKRKQSPQTLPFPPQAKNRKRKRLQELDDPHIHVTAKPLHKRQRKSKATSGVADNKLNPIDYWRKKGRWPKEYFKQDDQTRKDFKDEFEKDSWFEKCWIPETNMNHLLAQKKSSSSLRCKQSEVGSVTPSSTTPSDQKPREEKSAPYTNPRYRTVLETKGSFMDEFELGITKQSNDGYRVQTNQFLKIHYFVTTYSN